MYKYRKQYYKELWYLLFRYLGHNITARHNNAVDNSSNKTGILTTTRFENQTMYNEEQAEMNKIYTQDPNELTTVSNVMTRGDQMLAW